MSRVWEPLSSLPPVARPPGMRAAVLVPLYEGGGALRLVLTRRHGGMATHPGDVVFPGGRIEPGDEGPEETARREAWEEIGLPPAGVEVLGGLEPTTTRSTEMLIVPVVARVVRPERWVLAPGEVEAVLEPRLAELLDEVSWRREDWHGHALWFRPFPEGMLWGATARMVRSLLGYFRG
ncbi:MAG: CoA pyrophosphatase [Acidimicrobiia bacterium]|nr:CoA pyrophosphatase [Acidimicrobiia bacterium]